MKLLKKITNILFGKKEETHLQPKDIKQSRSPNCPLYAIVEENDNCTYMYLYELDGEENPKRIVGAAWIRNHTKSPSNIEYAAMKQGMPSMLPTKFCSHPNGKPKLDPDNLKFVWFEEGDGVALLENDDLICIMPTWSDDISPSYSKDCIKSHELLFPLEEGNVLIPRIRKAQEFWKSILEDQEDWWENFISPRLKILQNQFGDYKNYYAIDNEKWPAKALFRFEVEDMTYLITLGVSLIPQPQVELSIEKPEKARRIELGLAIETKKLMKNEKEFCTFVSATTNMPWHSLTWLGHGHTLDSRFYIDIKNTSPYMVFIEGQQDKILPQIKLPKYRGDFINILWMVHITEADFDTIKSKGITKYIKEKCDV